MYSYANKFNIATNPDKTEVILNFAQETPEFVPDPAQGEQGEANVTMTTKTESVANIVVAGAFAREIARMIMSLTGETNQ